MVNSDETERKLDDHVHVTCGVHVDWAPSELKTAST